MKPYKAVPDIKKEVPVVIKKEEPKVKIEDIPEMIFQYIPIDKWENLPLGTIRDMGGVKAQLISIEMKYESRTVVEKWKVKYDERN